MCFKKLFGNTPPLPEEQPYSGKTALLFAINAYKGAPLKGCLNDQKMVEAWLNTFYPDFIVYKFSDKQVTKNVFKSWCKKYKDLLRPSDDLFIHDSGHGTRGFDHQGEEADGYSEALYFYDGPVWDYELREIFSDIPDGARLTLAFDTCFSGGALSRRHNYIMPRYYETQKIPGGVKRKQAFMKFDCDNIVQFAACKEGQTAADAYIDGQYCGAFTYGWMKTYINEILNAWLDKIKQKIINFEQVPELYGSINMKNKLIFT